MFYCFKTKNKNFGSELLSTIKFSINTMPLKLCTTNTEQIIKKVPSVNHYTIPPVKIRFWCLYNQHKLWTKCFVSLSVCKFCFLLKFNALIKKENYFMLFNAPRKLWYNFVIDCPRSHDIWKMIQTQNCQLRNNVSGHHRNWAQSQVLRVRWNSIRLLALCFKSPGIKESWAYGLKPSLELTLY